MLGQGLAPVRAVAGSGPHRVIHQVKLLAGRQPDGGLLFQEPLNHGTEAHSCRDSALRSTCLACEGVRLVLWKL